MLIRTTFLTLYHWKQIYCTYFDQDHVLIVIWLDYECDWVLYNTCNYKTIVGSELTSSIFHQIYNKNKIFKTAQHAPWMSKHEIFGIVYRLSFLGMKSWRCQFWVSFLPNMKINEKSITRTRMNWMWIFNTRR
jgi:hypothetical protein